MLAEAAGLTERDPELTTLSKQQIERVVGNYTTISGDISVMAQDGGITMQTKRAALESGEEQTFPPVDLQPVSELEFMATEGDEEGMRIDFIPNADGSIRFVRMGGRVATRV